MARPRKPQPGEHVPTYASKELARSLYLGGSSLEDIARLMGIKGETLIKHYRQDIDFSFQSMRAILASKLYDDALAGDKSSRELWLKTRGKWSN